MPEMLRLDIEPKFIDPTTMLCRKRMEGLQFIQQGKTAQCAYVEQFNRPHRGEKLVLWVTNSMDGIRCDSWE